MERKRLNIETLQKNKYNTITNVRVEEKKDINQKHDAKFREGHKESFGENKTKLE